MISFVLMAFVHMVKQHGKNKRKFHSPREKMIAIRLFMGLYGMAMLRCGTPAQGSAGCTEITEFACEYEVP